MGSLLGGVDARSEAAAPASTARATPTAAAGIPPLASASQVSAAPQEGNVIGVSPAAAGAAAPSIAANVAALNATLASRYLFIEPISSPSPDSDNDVAYRLPQQV